MTWRKSYIRSNNMEAAQRFDDLLKEKGENNDRRRNFFQTEFFIGRGKEFINQR